VPPSRPPRRPATSWSAPPTWSACWSAPRSARARTQGGGGHLPDQVRLANGTRFTCTVLIEGTTAPYAVTLRDVDAARATVRCGAAKVRVVEVGAGIACTITLGGAVQKVTAEVKDLKGTVVVRG
jgi:hypothetical protein